MQTETVLITVPQDSLSILIPDDKAFRGNEYLPAKDLDRMVKSLLGDQERFIDFQNLSISCLWKKKGGTSKGRAVLAKITAVSGLLTHYCKEDFVISFSADNLIAACQGISILPHRMAEALCFHELCHLEWDSEEGTARLVGHEFEGFYEELQKYGDVLQPLRKVREVAQLPLFGKVE